MSWSSRRLDDIVQPMTKSGEFPSSAPERNEDLALISLRELRKSKQNQLEEMKSTFLTRKEIDDSAVAAIASAECSMNLLEDRHLSLQVYCLLCPLLLPHPPLTRPLSLPSLLSPLSNNSISGSPLSLPSFKSTLPPLRLILNLSNKSSLSHNNSVKISVTIATSSMRNLIVFNENRKRC
jgi:hypothetical protein